MIKCYNCGTMNEETSEYCYKCGAGLHIIYCYRHAEAPAKFVCSKCERGLCEYCALPGKNIAHKLRNEMYCESCYDEMTDLMEEYKGAQKEAAKGIWGVFKVIGEAFIHLIGF